MHWTKDKNSCLTEFTFCRGRSIMGKYIRHGMLSEVNKCYGEKSRQDEARKMCEGRGLSFTYGVWKGPTMVTFKQRCERFEGDNHVESIPGHIPCGPLGEKFPGRRRKEPWGLQCPQTQWSEERKQYWKEGKEVMEPLVRWARPLIARALVFILNEMESHCQCHNLTHSEDFSGYYVWIGHTESERPFSLRPSSVIHPFFLLYFCPSSKSRITQQIVTVLSLFRPSLLRIINLPFIYTDFRSWLST